jgi:hypothetical protein
MNFVREGGHTLTREGSQTPVTDEKEMHALLESALEKALKNLAKKALLLKKPNQPATAGHKGS